MTWLTPSCQRARVLQSQGFTEETNAEFAQIMQMLKSFQLQQKLQQQRQNMVGGGFQQSPMSPVQVPSQQPRPSQPRPPMPAQQQQQQQQQQPMMDASASPGMHEYENTVAIRILNVFTLAVPPHSVFTQAQLGALKYQILAYKLISKNMPLPQHIQQAVLQPFTTSDDSSATATLTTSIGAGGGERTTDSAASITGASAVSNGIASPAGAGSTATNSSKQPSVTASPQQTLQQVVPQTTPSSAQVPLPGQPTPEYNAYASPYNMLKKPITSYAHASRQHRQLIPSITPVGVDSQKLAEERERRISEHIQDRIHELEKISGSMMEKLKEQDVNVNKSSASSTPLRSLIELKSLKLLDKQKKVLVQFFLWFSIHVSLTIYRIVTPRNGSWHVKSNPARHIS